ncbi:MAG: 2-dehydro-3-deoxygalactonokinase [Propylenella sp.]
MARAALIGVDWGTSSLRAFLLDAGGNILDRREGPHGILTVKDGNFAAVLAAEIAAWLERAKVPVLLSGMIGSRQGWVEAPYLDAPAGDLDLAAALTRAPFDAADVRIVAGVTTTAGGMRDAMRGEEVQVLGALARLGLDAGRFVLPGTHSKWVTAEAGRVTSVATYMTGEVYSALRTQTILARLMQEGEASPEAFEEGVRDGARAGTPGALLNRLFGVRTAGLFDRFRAAELPDYLSGMLIGAELADQRDKSAAPLHIIASDALAERYRTAAAALGMAAEAAPADCVADGLMTIARLAGMV